LLDRERQSDIFANYKAVAYLSYVRGVVDVGEFLEYEEQDAAKKVLVYESLRSQMIEYFSRCSGIFTMRS
jgi:hypothetical protein